MPSNTDVQNIQLTQYNLYVDGVDAGLLEDGAVSFSINGEEIVVDNVEQISGIVKSWDTGLPITGSVKFERTDFAFFRDIIAQGRVDQRNSGSSFALGMGTKRRDVTTDHTVPVLFHPTHLPLASKEGDAYFWKVAFDLSDVPWVGSRTEHQTIEVPMKVFPDLDQENGWEYGIFGDWTLTSSTPLGCFFTMKNQIYEPGLHLDAFAIKPGQIDSFNLFAFFGDTTTSPITATIDNVAGYTATDTTMVFDALSSANGLAAGDYIVLVTDTGNEYLYLTSVTYTSSTAGSFDCVRKTNGSDDNNDTVTDGAAITRIADPYWVNHTNSGGTLSNGTPATATVGDTYGSTTTTSKPLVVEGLAVGTTDVSVTFGGVSTPTTNPLVITVAN
jgi:hypothetical protein